MRCVSVVVGYGTVMLASFPAKLTVVCSVHALELPSCAWFVDTYVTLQ